MKSLLSLISLSMLSTLAAAQSMVSVSFFEPVAGTLPGFPVQNVPGFNTAASCAEKCRTTAGCVASVFKPVHNGQPLNICWLKDRMVLSNWVPTSNGVFCTKTNEPCSVSRKTRSATDTAPFYGNLIQDYNWEPTAILLPGWPQSGVPATANAGLCEAWCKYYSQCSAFVFMPTYGTQKNYCALYRSALTWVPRATSARCPPATRCVIKRK